ncbi:hypothetical protein F5Y14DRAFT_405018 [Nemania sp. NC0429]|nr:hypothetical protein F5Y14DRAFT_405018 [Nemania sp. NC0429]
MVPFKLNLRVAAANFSTSAIQQRQQWTELSDVFSVILLDLLERRRGGPRPAGDRRGAICHPRGVNRLRDHRLRHDSSLDHGRLAAVARGKVGVPAQFAQHLHPDQGQRLPARARHPGERPGPQLRGPRHRRAETVRLVRPRDEIKPSRNSTIVDRPAHRGRRRVDEHLVPARGRPPWHAAERPRRGLAAGPERARRAFRAVIGELTTMDSLLALKAEMMGLGRCLLTIFFPGELLPEETAAWDALSRKAAAEEQRQRRERLERSRADHPRERWVAHAKNFELRRRKDGATARRRRRRRRLLGPLHSCVC